MPYYHVYVRYYGQSRDAFEETYELDLSLKKLHERIVTPYLNGEVFMCGGHQVNPFSTEQIMISKSIEASEKLIPKIRAEEARKSAETGFVFGISEEFSVIDYGENVTREFITHAPTKNRVREKAKIKKKTVIDEIISEVTDKLRVTIRKAPEKETEVQNALETLFVIRNYDFEREKVSFTYSTKSYQPDFTFDSLNLAIDAKLCNSERDEKEIIDQINADIVGYRTKYANLIFFVYDLGFIRDAKKFSRGIEKSTQNVHVRVIKH